MRQLLLWTAVCCLVLLPLCVGGKRVVFMPSPFTSHTIYHTNVARTLARQGHEVWLTMPDYIVNRRVLDTTNLTVIEYKTLKNFEEIMTAAFPGNYFKGLSDDFSVLMSIGLQFCDTLLTNASFFQKWPIDMLVARAEIWLVTTEHILDYPRPSMPNVKLIGGTATGPEDQKSIENLKMRQLLLWTAVCCLVLLPLCVGGKRVVFMPSPFTSHTNYHTNVARTFARQGHEVWLTMPDYIVNRRVFDTTNLTVIEYQTLKNFEEMFTAAFPGNYFKGLSEDFSNDLLAHPNTRVFCQPCGKNGQYEALFHAVPVVCTPLFADQFYNAERMRVKGMAETVDLKHTVSTHELHSTILKVATNTSYKQAITKASNCLKNRIRCSCGESGLLA
ncbi:hypothetical protein C0Q70_12012 [Pomacea canaliculata]|uniref:Glucuronosyltransferase n=1 Tax=Pomacea canaliculata TaxID=400727 RepID=A0A2T7P0B7_POMCA|nr:hypothetical protein C0Q70_12012 [Pomacea canaliculata]